MTPSDIEPSTFRLLAQCLNQAYKGETAVIIQDVLMGTWSQ